MLTREGIDSLRERLAVVRGAGSRYFTHADPVAIDNVFGTHSWRIENDAIQNEAEDLRTTIKKLGVDIAGAARGSPLIAEADLQDLRHNTRQMLANVRFNRYRHSGTYVHHDEGIVLGVDPPSQNEDPVDEVATAHSLFDGAATAVLDLIDVLSPSETVQSAVLSSWG